jgi:5-methylcytosine-specific restriction endonuclease McrA
MGKLCRCGCGNLVTNENNNWINHHFKGLRHSEETKKRIGKLNSLDLDEEYIRKAYTEQDKTTIDIAKKLGTYDSVILRRLKKMGISTKHRFTTKGRERMIESSRKYLLAHPIINSLEVRKEIGNKCKERWKNKNYRKMMSEKISLSKKYNPKSKWKKTDEIKNKMSIARKLWYQNNPEKAISKEAKRYNSNIANGCNVRERNHSWLGGISFEPYNIDFNNKFKRVIRKRDNYICMICGIHQEKMRESLTVHHINYDKQLSIPENCVALCRSCHTKTNNNREHWRLFFQSLLNKNYNYLYNKENDIILNGKINQGGDIDG